jgi:putative membrane protein
VVNAEDSARVRDLLASNRTLLAWVRTSISFSALGFAVAKFELRPDQAKLSVYLGMVLVIVGAAMAIIGYIQHRNLLIQELAPPGAPAPTRWPGVVATVACLGVCAILLPYLAVTVS